ncbi:probable ATP-dependent RNA helicase DDX20 [Achroia grisella]|uniref:probable ATP-dependent RNA helicase DDX20 n=1 Tax=Achroia grisella TaxID=688607 RepID=UPI0027D251D0|nr:probable ATP-dependent RNA helicase DDX20 [Achroia grisella]
MVLAHDITVGERTQDIQISQDITFDTMLLKSNTLRGLNSAGFQKPSPIQLHGIPMGKCGFDLLLEAKSGTGKTAVFAVVALEKLSLDVGLQAVILAPTREIAAQICDVIKQIGLYYEGLNVEVVMGGLPVQDDICKFKNKVHIVVGSPGRLCHLIQDKHIDVSTVRLLILDEADKLMEKSFQTDINFIFSILPKDKQVITSSATYNEYAKEFITKYVKNSQHICPNSNCVLLGVDQKITTVKYNSNIVRQTQYRFQELLKILTTKQFKQCLLFCNYQVRVAELYKLLLQNKWPAEQLYGQQEQTDRLDALKTLQEYKCRILICTDLAARGIDASNVDLVINFEPPIEWQTYLHRIGRAGRFGSYGMSITILSEGKEEEKFKKMLIIMRDTLNLRDFWSNDEIDFNANLHTKLRTQLVQPDINKKSSKYDELWHLLTENIKASDDKFENFENLCKSYENDYNKFDSFHTLLQSFQNNQHNIITENNSYQHLKVKDVLDDNVFIILDNSKKIVINDTRTKTIDIDPIIEMKNKSSNVEIFDNVKEIVSYDNQITVSMSLGLGTDTNKSNTPNERKDSILSVRKIYGNTELSYSTDGLLNLNLPTEFGSTKYHNKGLRNKKSILSQVLSNTLNLR